MGRAHQSWSKLRPCQVLGVLFCAPFLFMLYATLKLDLRVGGLPVEQLGESSGGMPGAADGSSSSGGGGGTGVGARPSKQAALLHLLEQESGRAARRRLAEEVPGVRRLAPLGSGRHLGASSRSSSSSTGGGSAVLSSLRGGWGGRTQQQQAEEQPRVWLYTLLGADYEGTAALLPHWLSHYLHRLGFARERLLVVVNTHSGRPEAMAELAAVRRVLGEWGIGHRLWTGKYSSDAHLKVKLELLQERVEDLGDWIVIADSDEFHSYTGFGTVSQLLRAAEQQGSNWVQGQLVDRVSPSGRLAPVQAEPDLFSQFPYNCHVVRHVSHGSVWKVMASRAYWRTNTGNHWVVGPDRAREYFGGAEPGVRGPRGGWFGAEDLWPYTPYSRHQGRYQYNTSAPDPGLWQLAQFPQVMPVFHFKWHQGVLQSAADRYEHYSGNATQPGGLPRYKHFRESRNILEALATGAIDMQASQCSLEPPVLQERSLQ